MTGRSTDRIPDVGTCGPYQQDDKQRHVFSPFFPEPSPSGKSFFFSRSVDERTTIRPCNKTHKLWGASRVSVWACFRKWVLGSPALYGEGACLEFFTAQVGKVLVGDESPAELSWTHDWGTIRHLKKSTY